MNYTEWLEVVPSQIKGDTLWKQVVYRLALFAADLAWHDVTKLFADGRTVKLAGQLYDAVGSIGANFSEGYSPGSQKDRARFHEYALGSARESRTWYFDGRHVLGERVSQHRVRLHPQIIRLLLAIVPSERGDSLHEGDGASALILTDDTANPSELPELLENVPVPEP
jgi:four helix bundle protein